MPVYRCEECGGECIVQIFNPKPHYYPARLMGSDCCKADVTDEQGRVLDVNDLNGWLDRGAMAQER